MERSGAYFSRKRFQSANQRGAPPRALPAVGLVPAVGLGPVIGLVLAVGLVLAFLVPLFPKQTPAGTALFHAPPLPAAITPFRDPTLFVDGHALSHDTECVRADGSFPCNGTPCGHRALLQPLFPPRAPDPQSDRNTPKPDDACWAGSPFQFSAFRRMESARPPGLRGAFLRISTGEWAPLPRSFTGNRRYLGAVRSFLHLRGDLERMCTRAI